MNMDVVIADDGWFLSRDWVGEFDPAIVDYVVANRLVTGRVIVGPGGVDTPSGDVVRFARSLGAEVLVHDPMYTDDELRGYGWDPYEWTPGTPGEPVDVALVQADHPEYAQLSAADLPGLRVLLDGRRITDPTRFTGVPRITIGGGETPTI